MQTYIDVSWGNPCQPEAYSCWETFCLDNYMTQWVNEHPEYAFDRGQKSWLEHDVSPRDSYIRLAWMVRNGREEQAVDRLLEIADEYIW